MPKLFDLSDSTFRNNEASRKEALYKAFQELLEQENISAVIYPTYLSTPIRSGRDENGVYWSASSQTNINNCRTLSPSAGIPEITVPIGVHSLGAGIGMEIASLKNKEQLLLDIAYSYTSAYDHRQTPAGAPNAYAQDYVTSLTQLAAGHTLIQDAVRAVSSVGLQLPLEGKGVYCTQWDRTNQQGNWILEFWPFVLLAFLLIAFFALLFKLIGKKQRKRKRQKVA